MINLALRVKNIKTRIFPIMRLEKWEELVSTSALTPMSAKQPLSKGAEIEGSPLRGMLADPVDRVASGEARRPPSQARS